jgi:hypothetical protein
MTLNLLENIWGSNYIKTNYSIRRVMMMKYVATLVFVLAICTGFMIADDKKPVEVKNPKAVTLPSKEEVPQYLQDISVTIRAGNAEGSGVVTNINGDCYVLTCGHVVQHLRSVRNYEDAGRMKVATDWADAEIVKEHVEDGRIVGQTRMTAFVIKYSGADHGEDLAILKVRKKNVLPTRVVFYNDAKIPQIGTELWHVGSLLGQGGSNSLTGGHISQLGRVYQGVVYDQTTCPAFPGSSGGGVYLKDGRYCGMIVRGAGETFNLIVPVRRIGDWCKRTKTEWLLDPSVPAPKIDAEWLRKNEIEDNHHQPTTPSTDKKEYNFLIKIVDRPVAPMPKP